MTSSDVGVREWTDEDGHLPILSSLCICMCLHYRICNYVLILCMCFYLFFCVNYISITILNTGLMPKGNSHFLSCKLSFRLGELPDGLPFLQVIPLQKNWPNNNSGSNCGDYFLRNHNDNETISLDEIRGSYFYEIKGKYVGKFKTTKLTWLGIKRIE